MNKIPIDILNDYMLSKNITGFKFNIEKLQCYKLTCDNCESKWCYPLLGFDAVTYATTSPIQNITNDGKHYFHTYNLCKNSTDFIHNIEFEFDKDIDTSKLSLIIYNEHERYDIKFDTFTKKIKPNIFVNTLQKKYLNCEIIYTEKIDAKLTFDSMYVDNNIRRQLINIGIILTSKEINNFL